MCSSESRIFGIRSIAKLADVFKHSISETAREYKNHGRQAGALYVNPDELLSFGHACDELEYRMLNEADQLLAEMGKRGGDNCKNVISAFQSKIFTFETEMICLLSQVFVAMDVGDEKKLGPIHADTPSLSYEMKVRMGKLIHCPYRLIPSPDESEYSITLTLLQEIDEKLNAAKFDGTISKMFNSHVNRLAKVSYRVHTNLGIASYTFSRG